MGIRLLVSGCMILTLCASARAQDWVKAHSGWPNDTVNAMVMTRSNILVGTQNGLFCSTNGGTTWSNVTVAGSPGTSAGAIRGLNTDGTSVIVQADTNYFVSTNEGIGSWSQITVSTLPWADMYHTRRIKPSSLMVKGSRVIFGTPYYGPTGAEAAIYYTTDLGTTWTVDGTGHFSKSAGAAAFLAVDNVPYIYLIVQNDNPTINNVQIARSTDDGVTWGYLRTPPQSTLSWSVTTGTAMDGSRLYVGIASLWFQNLVSIAPGETSWTTLSGALPVWTDLAHAQAPGYYPIAARSGSLWAVYRDTLLQSTNNGSSWTDISSNLPATKKRLLVTDNAIFVATNNGVYKKTRNTTGALSITLYKEYLGSLTGPTGKVSLYNDAWSLVAQKNADEYSVALFSALPTGTYAFDVRNTPATPWGEQYWGWRSHIVVSADATKYVSHSHNTPLIAAVRVYINATNELLPLSPTTPKDIPTGTVLRIELDITNPDVIDAEAAESYAMVYLDRDRSASYDATLTSTGQSYTVGQSRTVSLLTTAASVGSYSLSAAAVTVYSGGPLVTDGSGWSGPVFTVSSSAPVLLAPSNGATEVSPAATLRWTRPAGVTSFHCQIATDSAFSSGVTLNDTTGTDTVRTASGLSNAQTYYWHVRGKTSGVYGPWSSRWKFATAMPLPGAVTLLTPAHNAVVNADTLRLQWRSATPGVDRYWLEYSFDSTFTIKATDSLLTDTTTVLRSMAKSTGYYWHIRAHNPSGWGPYSSTSRFVRSATGVDQHPQGVPGSWVLAQNYPNPFNPSTTITFGLPERARVRLIVYNTLGEVVSELTDAEWDAGYHSVPFNAAHLSSGVYFYRMDAGPLVMTRRLMLLR